MLTLTKVTLFLLDLLRNAFDTHWNTDTQMKGSERLPGKRISVVLLNSWHLFVFYIFALGRAEYVLLGYFFILTSCIPNPDSSANCLDGPTLLDHKSLGQPEDEPQHGEAYFPTPSILGTPTCEDPTPSNIWFSHNFAKGEADAFFVWDLGCCYMTRYHLLRN